MKYKCTVPFGPSGHWLYGHANFPPRDLTPTWAAWSQDYGPIFQFRVLPFLPSINFIIVNDVQLCKDFLNNKDFANRENPEDTAFLLILNPEGKGILFQSLKPSWKELHFTTFILSSFGFGQLHMEDKVL
jgi:cytochrome P450